MAFVPGWPAQELLHEDQFVIFCISLITVAFAGMLGPDGELPEPVEVSLDPVEAEEAAVSCGAPPHPTIISASRQRLMPCNRIIRPPRDEVSATSFSLRMAAAQTQRTPHLD
jgi:hypothetical protein